MIALILHGNEKNDITGSGIQGMVCESLAAKGWETETKSVGEMSISPCVGCFNCWLKTPGICSRNDDGREVVKSIARCNVLIFLSPVTFGGYSSRLKVAVDRIIPSISPLFEKVNGEMHHRLRYKPPHSFLSVGWQRELDAESAEVFTRLAARNARNMHAPASGSVVLHGGQTPEERRAQVEQLVAKLETAHG
jgi:multimeric flavodoxin WrbA